MLKTLLNSLKKQLSQLDFQLQNEESSYRYASLQIPLAKQIALSPIRFSDSFFLSQPDSGFTLLGLDSLLSFKRHGVQRFDAIKDDFSRCLKQWFRNDNDSLHLPIAFLAFAFDDNDAMQGYWQGIPNTLLTIPRILFKEEHSAQSLIVNIKLDSSYSAQLSIIETLLQLFFAQEKTQTRQNAHSTVVKNKQTDTAYKHWKSLAQYAIKQIKSRKFDKLVTSRCHSLRTSDTISTSHLVNKLAHYYPCCSILSYSSCDKTIVAASPEQLLSLQYPDIQSSAIGGTISRNKQSDQQSQSLPFFLKHATEQSSGEFSESKKLLKEHHFISQAIYQNLDPLCYTLKMPVTPFLMKLHNLYHLETPVQGKLMDKHDLFDCIKALHPTPAVAGIPSQQAKQWLINNEDYDRGWYTGAFGWIDANMNGDLSVMLRCALIENTQSKKQTIHLFAGAGLVAESNPDAEWQETELKMQTIMEILR